MIQIQARNDKKVCQDSIGIAQDSVVNQDQDIVIQKGMASDIRINR